MIDDFVSRIKCLFLICYRKLTVILVPVGKGEGDNVIPRIGNVDLQAVGCLDGSVINGGPCSRGNLHGHLAKVFGEHHTKRPFPMDLQSPLSLFLHYFVRKRFPVFQRNTHRIGTSGQTLHVEAFQAAALRKYQASFQVV